MRPTYADPAAHPCTRPNPFIHGIRHASSASGWLWHIVPHHCPVRAVTDNFGNLVYAPSPGLSVSLWDLAYELHYSGA